MEPSLHTHLQSEARAPKMLQVLAEQVANCTQCGLHATRTQTVFSRGNPEASICMVAEAPGAQEDLSGSPLIGMSGQLLDKAIQSLGYDPATDIYVCNIIKCRPPLNRRPLSEEIQACYPHIEQQLSLIKARVLITLGATATHAITDQTKGMMQLRGQVFTYKDKRVLACVHPSWVLRQGGETSDAYNQFRDDIKLAFELATSGESHAAETEQQP